MVEVVNMRTCNPKWGQPGDVRIDRVSKWGNPFHIGVLTRDDVCNEYEVQFNGDISEISNAKRLGCWCKPRRCHGDFLKKRIDEYNANKQVKLC